MTDRTLSVKDICERFAVSEHTVLGWIRSGELRAISISRKPGAKKPRWRITQEALDGFELARTHNPPPPRTRRKKHDTSVVEFY